MKYPSQEEQDKLAALRQADPFVDETLRELERVFGSASFERVQQKAKEFLNFVVTKTLLGQIQDIKEVMIGVEVYEKPDYDPTTDTTVRVAAGDLRRRLRTFFDGEGRNDPIHIEIPGGTYVPVIKKSQPTIALGLFENWNPGDDQGYLCGTLSDEIAHELRHAGLNWVSRVPTLESLDHQFGFGVRGSLECRENLVRLNVSLRDLYRQRIILSRAFEERREDIFKLASQTAKAIFEAVNSEAGNPMPISRGSTETFDALQLCEQGREHLRKRTGSHIREAIHLFEKAIDVNPSYARAHSGLADCYLVASWYAIVTSARIWFEAAKTRALKALELEPGLLEGITSLAYAKLLCDFDWKGAEEEFQRAIRFQNRYARARHWHSNLLVMQGRFTEAEAEIKRAFDLAPGSIVVRKTLGDPFYYSQRYEQAAMCYRSALKVDSTFWMSHLFLGWCYQQMGDADAALQEFEAVTERAGVNSIVQGAIGHLYATSGREEKAMAVIDQLRDDPNTPYVAPHTLAVIYAGLGDNDRAFEYLNASFENRIELLCWIKVDPRFDRLRNDPRFDEFLRRMGLAEDASQGR